jgi:hypothetical protein
VAYDFSFDDDDVNMYLAEKAYVDITARVASAAQSQKTFTMQIMDGNQEGAWEYFETTGKGYQNFADITWYRVPIDLSYDIHKLVIGFTEGNINLCSVHVEWHDDDHTTRNFTPRRQDATPLHGKVPPATWSAFEYDKAYDTSPDSFECGCQEYDRDDGVDGVHTSVSRERTSCRSSTTLSISQTTLMMNS